MTTNPMAVLMVILLNSAQRISRQAGEPCSRKGIGLISTGLAGTARIPLRSGLVHRLTSRTLFLANSLSGVTTVSICCGLLVACQALRANG